MTKLKAKRTCAALCAMLLCLTVLTSIYGCKGTDDGRDSVVCTSFVVYDWVKNVLGEDAPSWNIIMLGARGADIHSYQPTVRDIAALSRARVFVRIGGESETWVEDVLRSAANPSLDELSLCSALEDKLCHSEGEHVHEVHDGHDHEYDEHIWFSPELVYASVSQIAQVLGKAKPEKAELYAENAESYTAALREIEARYLTLADNAERDSIIVCDRYPFYYLGEFMGLEYDAAFEGCSAESEAGFSVVSRLARSIERTGAECVLVCEGSDKAIARAVIGAQKNENVKILTLDSMQSVTQAEADSGVSYISILEKNLEALREALS